MRLFEYLIGLSALWLVLATASATTTGAELLIVEQDHCPYCEKFNREIAQTYPKTVEGSRAPLVRLDIHKPWPNQYGSIHPASVTPTFILISDGAEIDRLVGYPGDEHFWFLIGQMLDKL